MALPAGALLLASLTFAFIEAGQSGFGSLVLVAALAALVLLAAFIAVERSRSDPTLPLILFRRPAFSVANSGPAA